MFKIILKKGLLNLVLSLFMNKSTKESNTRPKLNLHCKQKTFSPVSSLNSSKKDKTLPVKTSKANFVTFFVYFGNSWLDYCEMSLLITAANREGILLATSLARRNMR